MSSCRCGFTALQLASSLPARELHRFVCEGSRDPASTPLLESKGDGPELLAVAVRMIDLEDTITGLDAIAKRLLASSHQDSSVIGPIWSLRTTLAEKLRALLDRRDALLGGGGMSRRASNC